MAEAFNLLKRMRNLDTSPELSGYSGVRIYAGQDEDGNSIEFFSGDETGKVLEITNEWGTQAQADAICAKILGYRYQPFVATGTQLDPSAELGDAVTASDIYGGVFSRRSVYGRHITIDVEAPVYDELEHEFQIQSPTNRQYTRFTRQVRSSLSVTNTRISAEVSERKNSDEALSAQLQVQSDLIEAKVSKTGGSSSSFGWVLDESSWTIRGNSRDILKATAEGLEVYGKVIATSGTIGGFDITSDSLSYNSQTWNGTNTSGIYVGPQGIQLGKNFKVDANGNLTAASGTFTGRVHAGMIQYGDAAGYMSGGGISSGSIAGNRMQANTITTAYTSGGINTSLGFADFSNGVFNGWNTAPYLYVNYLHAENAFYMGNYRIQRESYSFKDGDGNQRTLYYLGWVRA